MTHRTTRFALIAALVGACFAPAAQAQSERTHAQLHASAVASFQQGRFPEAYGRSRPGQCRPRARCRAGCSCRKTTPRCSAGTGMSRKGS